MPIAYVSPKSYAALIKDIAPFAHYVNNDQGYRDLRILGVRVVASHWVNDDTAYIDPYPSLPGDGIIERFNDYYYGIFKETKKPIFTRVINKVDLP